MCLARHENWRFTNRMGGSRVRGGLRLAMVVWTAGLVLGPAPVAAQSAPAAATNTPAPDTVGPKELQNFSLSGTVTRPADQPPQRTTTTAAPTNRASAEPRNDSSTEAQSSALARDRPSARRTGSNSPVLTASRDTTL